MQKKGYKIEVWIVFIINQIERTFWKYIETTEGWQWQLTRNRNLKVLAASELRNVNTTNLMYSLENESPIAKHTSVLEKTLLVDVFSKRRFVNFKMIKTYCRSFWKITDSYSFICMNKWYEMALDYSWKLYDIQFKN